MWGSFPIGGGQWQNWSERGQNLYGRAPYLPSGAAFHSRPRIPRVLARSHQFGCTKLRGKAEEGEMAQEGQGKKKLRGLAEAELEVWEGRWKALDEQLVFLLREAEGLPGESDDFYTECRRETLERLVERLRLFAAGQFNFFKVSLKADENGNSALTSGKDYTEYPPEYLFHGIISQISHDIHLIRRALTQRKLAATKARMRNALDMADCLAWDALQPAVHGGLLYEGTEVLAYFEKLSSIRIIPYAPIALVAVPITCIGSPWEMLSIPHEVGHYVFRRGKKGDKSLRLKMREKLEKHRLPDYLLEWIDEIFADVYACLVAGPVVALSSQDVQLEREPEDFLTDDEHHPSPVLRPYIYTQTLQRGAEIAAWSSGSGAETWGEMLESYWSVRRENREKELGRCEELGVFFADGEDPHDKDYREIVVLGRQGEDGPKKVEIKTKHRNGIPISNVVTLGKPAQGTEYHRQMDQPVQEAMHLLDGAEWDRLDWWKTSRNVDWSREATRDKKVQHLRTWFTGFFMPDVEGRQSLEGLPEDGGEILSGILKWFKELFKPREIAQPSPSILPGGIDSKTTLNRAEAKIESEVEAALGNWIPGKPETLPEPWPEPFFTVPREQESGRGDLWWLGVWLARGWNTHGNGQWIDAP